MAQSEGCCCCNFIFTSGLTALFLWLSLRASKPTCSIQKIYLPALNQSSNSQSNTTLYLDLKLSNGNKDKAIYYDPLNFTIFYSPNMTHFIGTKTHPGFHQGHSKKATKTVTVETTGVDWKAVSRAVSANGSTVFRVNMATAMRYKILFWKTKRHKLRVGADVSVNDQGTKINKKGIKLKSGAPRVFGCYIAPVRVFLIVFVLVLLGFW